MPTRSPRTTPSVRSPSATRRTRSASVACEIGWYAPPTFTWSALGFPYRSTASKKRWLSVPGAGRGPPRAIIRISVRSWSRYRRCIENEADRTPADVGTAEANVGEDDDRVERRFQGCAGGDPKPPEGDA